MSVGGMQLQLAVTDGAAAGDGQRLDRAERERTGPLDQQVLVKRAQLALSFARRCPQALRRALCTAERDAGEGEPAEQMVPVAVRGKQPAGTREPGLLEQRRKRLELVGKNGRVDHEGLPLAIDRPTDNHAVDLENRTGGEEHIAMERDGSHRGSPTTSGDAEQL